MLKRFEIPTALFQIPQRYRFSSKSQRMNAANSLVGVVLDTTKVQIFKQITTDRRIITIITWLFQIPQRYRFSSKSQPSRMSNWQATVVLDTTKVQIFKQITTGLGYSLDPLKLFQIPQRYRFSSKSQHDGFTCTYPVGCFRYHKGTDFQANHNNIMKNFGPALVVLDTTKVQIFKQITTSTLVR